MLKELTTKVGENKTILLPLEACLGHDSSQEMLN